MLWSVNGFPNLVNGVGDRTPPTQREVWEAAKTFPDDSSVNRLRALGVRTVVVVKSLVEGTVYAGAAGAQHTNLDVEREDHPDTVVFHL
jgi:hypothetical protein